MLSLLQRIQSVENGLTLDSDYKEEIAALDAIEQEIPVYRRLGTPAWKAHQAKEEILRLRTWIREELAARTN